MPVDLASSLLFLGRLLLGGAFVFAGLRNNAGELELVAPNGIDH